MAYVVRFVPSARKALEKLPRGAQGRIVLALALLRQTPRPPNARKLTGEHDRWRVRVGDSRIVYQIADAELLILVVKIRLRRNVYRSV